MPPHIGATISTSPGDLREVALLGIDPAELVAGSAPGARGNACDRVADGHTWHDRSMQVSAKVEYAVRALLELASRPETLVTTEAISEQQELPRKFVESILSELRRAGFVRSQRGAVGGYALARPAEEITIGAVMRALEGPLAEVRGVRPDQTSYEGSASHLPDLWVAVRCSLRRVLDETTLSDVLAGTYPAHVQSLMSAEDAWLPR